MQEAPELLAVLHPVWEAFCILSRSRGQSFGGAAPIQISEMLVVAARECLDEEELREWVYLLQELDSEYLTVTAESKDK